MVQFYRDPAELQRSVGRYLSDGFARGESAVVIATGDHWNDFRRSLQELGRDPERLEKEGRLAVLDARSTLESFMSQGMPDDLLFQDTVGLVLSKLSARGAPNIRAFGEMVSLLWKDRRFEAALRLEELWNALSERRPFTLLCAYQGDPLAPERLVRPSECITLQHSHIVPAEDYDRVTRAVDQAMQEVLGRTEAAALNPLIAATQRRGTVLPGAQATLLWLQSNLPHHVDAVLAAARRWAASPA